jgi:hypothetical protein
MIILGSFFILSNFTKVNSLSSGDVPTTANVSVRGCLGIINLTYYPVNFTTGGGFSPGGFPVAKNNTKTYIIINMSINNNIAWDVFMNASNLIPLSGVGAPISPQNIMVSSPCNGTVDAALNPAMQNTTLDYTLKRLCSETQYNKNISVYFYLTIPVGQSNDTYFGNLTVYVNSTHSSTPECNNRTWDAPNNTTVLVHTNIDFLWDTSTTNIDFLTLSPGTGFGTPSANATFNKGFPANMTIGKNTNIRTDLYIKGTDLIGLTGQALAELYNISIGPTGNLTYSNATSNSTWPDRIKFINYSYQTPGPIYQGDFWNWGNVRNSTNTTSFWNISIPNDARQGNYGGGITATAIEKGAMP